jgi:fidgetin-like protein 1
LSPSIIFVDEIDSLLSSRSGGDNENEASRRLKTEFLIQWSSLASAAAARTNEESPRVLVLAATNLPWAIDDAARRRFVLRQYIPLPEPETRRVQFESLLSKQHHTLTEDQLDELVVLTEGPPQTKT